MDQLCLGLNKATWLTQSLGIPVMSKDQITQDGEFMRTEKWNMRDTRRLCRVWGLRG